MALPYSVKSDILEQIPEIDLAQLTDDNNGTTVDESIVTARISKADTFINSYIRGKNTVPGDPVATPQLQEWSVSLAIYFLYQRRTDLQMPSPISDDYKDVVSQLEGVRDGKIVIADPTSFNNTSGMYKSNGAAKGKLFTSNCEGTGTLDQYYNGPFPDGVRRR